MTTQNQTSTDRPAVVPKIVGTAAIADIFGVCHSTVYDRLRRGVHPFNVGYLGKIGGRHCWDVNQLLNDGGVEPCRVCGEPATAIGLCIDHALTFRRVWDRAERSRLSLLQFIAICRWVVDRWSHVGEIWMTDIWSTTCATPGCDGEANVGCLGPLCQECTASFRHSRLLGFLEPVPVPGDPLV